MADDKTSLERMWTHTNQETGEKEQRLHKKDAPDTDNNDNNNNVLPEEAPAAAASDASNAGNDAAATAPNDADALNAFNPLNAGNAANAGNEATEGKAPVGRLWTHTNPDTGDKEARLHKKEISLTNDANNANNSNDSNDSNQNGGDAGNAANEENNAEFGQNGENTLNAEEAAPEASGNEKQSLARMWTHTNAETGEKEARLHKKEEATGNELQNEENEQKAEETNETAQNEANADNAQNAENAQESEANEANGGNAANDENNGNEAKQAVSRAWTHTNAVTGEKEARLHRKENEDATEAAGAADGTEANAQVPEAIAEAEEEEDIDIDTNQAQNDANADAANDVNADVTEAAADAPDSSNVVNAGAGESKIEEEDGADTNVNGADAGGDKNEIEDVDIEMGSIDNNLNQTSAVQSAESTQQQQAPDAPEAAESANNANNAETAADTAESGNAPEAAAEASEAQEAGNSGDSANSGDLGEEDVDIEMAANPALEAANVADAPEAAEAVEKKQKLEETPDTSYQVPLAGEHEEFLSGLPWIWQECYKLLVLFKHFRQSEFFLSPVTEEEVPGYRKIIKRPMDLSTIESKILQGKYKLTNDSKVYDFSRDMQLIWKNAMTFNNISSVYYRAAAQLSDTFRRLFARLEFDWKLRDLRLGKYASERKIRGGAQQVEAICDEETILSALQVDQNGLQREMLVLQTGFTKQTQIYLSRLEQRQKFVKLIPQLMDYEMGLLIEILDKKCPFCINPVLEPEEKIEIPNDNNNNNNNNNNENNNSNNNNNNNNNSSNEKKNGEEDDVMFSVDIDNDLDVDVNYIDSLTIEDLCAWAKERIENRDDYMKPQAMLVQNDEQQQQQQQQGAAAAAALNGMDVPPQLMQQGQNGM